MSSAIFLRYFFLALRAAAPALLFAVAMASPSGTPDFIMAFAMLAALLAAEPESLWLWRDLKDFPVNGMAISKEKGPGQ
jgi:hypothetical protein